MTNSPNNYCENRICEYYTSPLNTPKSFQIFARTNGIPHPHTPHFTSHRMQVLDAFSRYGLPIGRGGRGRDRVTPPLWECSVLPTGNGWVFLEGLFKYKRLLHRQHSLPLPTPWEIEFSLSIAVSSQLTFTLLPCFFPSIFKNRSDLVALSGKELEIWFLPRKSYTPAGILP